MKGITIIKIIFIIMKIIIRKIIKILIIIIIAQIIKIKNNNNKHIYNK